MLGELLLGGTFLSAAIPAVYDYIKGFYSPTTEESKLTNHREIDDLKGEGIILSKNVRLSEQYSNIGVLVIAPSRTGKSRKIIMPNVNSLKKCTVICTDPKGEIEQEYIGKGKKVLILNPFSDKTVGYDPLFNCKDITSVRKVANIILTNGSLWAKSTSGNQTSGNHADWVQMATPLLTSYMIWNYYTKTHTFDVLIKRLVSEGLKTIGDEIMNSNVEEAKTLFKAFIQIGGAPQTLACIRNVLLTNLQLFLDGSVSKILQKKSIDLSKIRKEETILFIQIPEKDSIYFSPLTSVFISQLIDRLIEDSVDLQTYMLLDEACNIGYISGLPQTLSTCASRNISITACVQSLLQFERVYGTESKELTELFKTIVFMSGLKESAEYASKLIGRGRIDVKDGSGYRVGELMTGDQIRRLKSDELLIISGNKNPILDKMYC